MKHLRVETEAELDLISRLLQRASTDDAWDRPTARALLERLQAAPVARHGGVVHVEDANYLPTPGGRQ